MYILSAALHHVYLRPGFHAISRLGQGTVYRYAGRDPPETPPLRGDLWGRAITTARRQFFDHHPIPAP